MPHITVAPVKPCRIQLDNRTLWDYNWDFDWDWNPNYDFDYDFDWNPNFDFDYDFNGFDYHPDYNAWSAGVKVGYAHQYNSVFEHKDGSGNPIYVDLIGIYIKIGDADLDESLLYRAAGFTSINGASTEYCVYFTFLPGVTASPRWLAYVGLSGNFLQDHDSSGSTLNGGNLSTGTNNGITYYYVHVYNNIPKEPPEDADTLYGGFGQTGSLTKGVSSAEEAIAYVTGGNLPTPEPTPEPEPKKPNTSSGWTSSGGGKFPEPKEDRGYFLTPDGWYEYQPGATNGYTWSEMQEILQRLGKM